MPSVDFTHGNSVSPLVHREQEALQRSHAVAKSIALIAGGLILTGITVGFGAAGLAHGTMLLKWSVSLIVVGGSGGIGFITIGSVKLYKTLPIARTQRAVSNVLDPEAQSVEQPALKPNIPVPAVSLKLSLTEEASPISNNSQPSNRNQQSDSTRGNTSLVSLHDDELVTVLDFLTAQEAACSQKIDTNIRKLARKNSTTRERIIERYLLEEAIAVALKAAPLERVKGLCQVIAITAEEWGVEALELLSRTAALVNEGFDFSDTVIAHCEVARAYAKFNKLYAVDKLYTVDDRIFVHLECGAEIAQLEWQQALARSDGFLPSHDSILEVIRTARILGRKTQARDIFFTWIDRNLSAYNDATLIHPPVLSVNFTVNFIERLEAGSKNQLELIKELASLDLEEAKRRVGRITDPYFRSIAFCDITRVEAVKDKESAKITLHAAKQSARDIRERVTGFKKEELQFHAYFLLAKLEAEIYPEERSAFSDAFQAIDNLSTENVYNQLFAIIELAEMEGFIRPEEHQKLEEIDELLKKVPPIERNLLIPSILIRKTKIEILFKRGRGNSAQTLAEAERYASVVLREFEEIIGIRFNVDTPERMFFDDMIIWNELSPQSRERLQHFFLEFPFFKYVTKKDFKDIANLQAILGLEEAAETAVKSGKRYASAILQKLAVKKAKTDTSEAKTIASRIDDRFVYIVTLCEIAQLESKDDQLKTLEELEDIAAEELFEINRLKAIKALCLVAKGKHMIDTVLAVSTLKRAQRLCDRMNIEERTESNLLITQTMMALNRKEGMNWVQDIIMPMTQGESPALPGGVTPYLDLLQVLSPKAKVMPHEL